jgi:hypothetical protein
VIFFIFFFIIVVFAGCDTVHRIQIKQAIPSRAVVMWKLGNEAEG